MRPPGVSAGRSRLGLIATALGLAIALGLGSLRFFGAKAPVRAAEWWIGDLALVSVFALPAVVGLLASVGRPDLLVTAGILSFALSIALLVSVVTLPLVVPGILYLVAHRRAFRGRSVPRRTALVTLLLLACAAATLALLVLTPRTTVCWRQTEYANGRTVLMRDRVSERAASSGSFSQRLGPPSANVVSQESGCTDGVFPPSRSLGALGIVAAGVLVTWRTG